jgi:ketosteroid isomerase-like protein
MQTLNEGMQKINETFTQALQAGDAQTLSQVYTKNALLMVPNAEIVKGRSDIEAFYRGILNAGFHDHIYERIALEERAGLGYEAAQFTMFTKNEQGGVKETRGKHLLILKHTDDRWWVHIDIWNDSPLTSG